MFNNTLKIILALLGVVAVPSNCAQEKLSFLVTIGCVESSRENYSFSDDEFAMIEKTICQKLEASGKIAELKYKD